MQTTTEKNEELFRRYLGIPLSIDYKHSEPYENVVPSIFYSLYLSYGKKGSSFVPVSKSALQFELDEQRTSGIQGVFTCEKWHSGFRLEFQTNRYHGCEEPLLSVTARQHLGIPQFEYAIAGLSQKIGVPAADMPYYAHNRHVFLVNIACKYVLPYDGEFRSRMKERIVTMSLRETTAVR